MNETVAIPAGKPSEPGRGEREAVERNIVRTRSGKIKIKGRNRSQTAITALCLVLLGITAVAFATFDTGSIDFGQAVLDTLHNIRTVFLEPELVRDTVGGVLYQLLVTFCLGILSTIIGAVLAFFCSLLCARNIAHPACVNAVKSVVAVVRAVPTVLWVLIFAVSAGLGSVAVCILRRECLSSFGLRRKGALPAILGTLLCFVLCSCQTVLPANEKAQVEELLRAPKLSGDYGALQTALNDWLGESAQLKYPIQGELLSPFVLQDLDGDGQQDAAVLYTTAQTANVCVAILQRDDAGSWQVRQSVEGLAETVENVSLAQLQDTDSCQLVVGYTAAQNDHYLAVYSYQKGTLSTILEQQYEQYLVENITGGSSQDLILMSTQEDGSVQIELLTADREGSFRQVAVNGLSADKFSGCASVAAGAGADGRHYLVLDGWTGISGNNLASVLLCYDETSQQMVPATRISSQRLYNASLRNVPTLVSRDLDGDGIVEIPTQPDEAGLLNLSQSRRMDFIVWMDYTSSHPEKSFGLLDEETNCYIELPAEWEGNLKLTDSEEFDGAVELRTVDEDQLVLTVRLASTSANSTGWTRLGVVASRQVQARMGPDVLLSDTNYRLSKALYLLN